MNSERIKEIHQGTAYPNSISVHQALLQVWNECAQERRYSKEDMREAFNQSRQAKIFEINMPPAYENFDDWIK